MQKRCRCLLDQVRFSTLRGLAVRPLAPNYEKELRVDQWSCAHYPRPSRGVTNPVDSWLSGRRNEVNVVDRLAFAPVDRRVKRAVRLSTVGSIETAAGPK
jgi:hypothetical protein